MVINDSRIFLPGVRILLSLVVDSLFKHLHRLTGVSTESKTDLRMEPVLEDGGSISLLEEVDDGGPIDVRVTVEDLRVGFSTVRGIVVKLFMDFRDYSSGLFPLVVVKLALLLFGEV